VIVVGVDGSQGSRRALAWALEEARLRRASVRAVYAYLVPPGFGWGYLPPGRIDRSFFRDRAEELVEGLVAELAGADRRGGTVCGAAVEGVPAEVLCGAARHAELLVVGSRGLGGFGGLLLGSVSHQCAQHAPCPVVVVR
jgi:nucleotide-binding universal stress UspA family protein